MAHDYSKLRGRIVEKCGTIGAFAEKIGTPQANISSKLHDRYGITPKEIISWSELLEIPKGDIGEYFFTLKV